MKHECTSIRTTRYTSQHVKKATAKQQRHDILTALQQGNQQHAEWEVSEH